MRQRILKLADKWVILLLFFITVALGVQRNGIATMERVIWSDGEGYYLYLPATFIYDGWKQSDSYRNDGEDGMHMIACCAVNDQRIIQTRYTYGVAALQAPFFLMAHAYASTFQGPGSAPPIEIEVEAGNDWKKHLVSRRYSEKRGQATGFSSVYGLAAVVSAAFFLALGLWFLKKILLQHFSVLTSLAVVCLIFFGTNLLYYSTREMLMSHVYSFSLFAAFIYCLPGWLENPNWRKSIVIGLVMAFIFLIRPTNIIIALLLVFWEVYDWTAFKARLGMLLRAWPQLLLFGLITIVVMIPQMLYWKTAFGGYLTWSYGNEGFKYWANPQILQVLFSPQNGLFAYTPVMLFALVGIVVAWRKRLISGPGTALIFLLATYTFASWWAWWFGGAFGHRCYVEFYALLAIPLGLIVEKVAKSPAKWLRFAGIALFFIFIYVNVKLVAIYDPPWDGPDWGFDDYLGRIKNVARIWWWPGF